jgi:TolB-like protein
VQVLALVLVLGAPIVVLLAWYHGHKARHRVSGAELSMMTALFIIAGTLLWAFTRHSAVRAPAVSSSATVSSHTGLGATEPSASVAVVPFANLTGDPSKDYFSDGMAEELIDALANVPGLKVPSRTSSFAYKGRELDVRRIAQDLGVAKILEGSVRSAGETVRVTAQLVDAQSGYHVWSQTYDRKFADIFELQDELAKAIVAQLLGKIDAGAADSGIKSPSTQNVEAYQLYLQASALAGAPSETNAHRGIDLLDQAIALDPTYAEAWAARAGMRSGLVAFGGASPDELQQAERDARRAEALRPNSALIDLAFIHDQRGRWIEAEREYQAALSTVDGAEPLAHITYANHLGAAGRLQAALAQATEAYRLAPTYLIGIGAAGNAYVWLGDDAQALKFADLLTELGDPGHGASSIYGAVALRRGHFEEASTRLISGLSEEERAAGGAEVVKLVVEAAADPAKMPEARKSLDGFTRRLSVGHPTSWLLGAYSVIAAPDETYADINRALDKGPDGFFGGLSILWLPEVRPFRRDPRFQQLVTKLKLFEYWKQYGPPDECDLRGENLTCR